MPFGDVLRAHMSRPPGYSPGLVSRLSGVPKATIVNWLTGRVARPRRWQDLVRVADAMRLGHGEVDELLAAASQPSLVELARVIDDDGRVLLEPWVSSASSGLPVAAQLPLVATPFLGRTSERGAVISLVCDPDVRVVTLTAVAGVGKTRLAIEVAGAFRRHTLKSFARTPRLKRTTGSERHNQCRHQHGDRGDRWPWRAKLPHPGTSTTT
ncbi:MAG: helix-turn-helix domain-containing protein [Actinomycetota bacterium]|nr:helix-turn-helix domain-containing protein [Actinomycetota bacterium]